MGFENYEKKECRYCDSPLGDPFLELGVMPLANSYLDEKTLQKEEFKCPLSLTRCSSCGLIQLSHVVPPEKMFAHYLYVSSTTKTFQKHFADYADSVKKRLVNKETGLAVDIGSNDGLLLACYEKAGLSAVGVDPAKNLADEANANGLKTLNRYFDEESVAEIVRDHGKADIVSGNNVFAHISDVQSVCRNVKALLDEQGLFVIEFPYLPTMLEELLFDMIYHEHLSYIALNSLVVLLDRFDLEIFDVEQVASHGGSLRVYIQNKGAARIPEKIVGELLQAERDKKYDTEAPYLKFAEDVKQVRVELRNTVESAKSDGKRIVGYGAPAKASTIIGFCQFTADEITYIVDDNPLKQNHYVPGAAIPISPSSRLEAEQPDLLIIFAWNFAKEIVQKISFLEEKGVQFMVPLPKPRILSSQNAQTH